MKKGPKRSHTAKRSTGSVRANTGSPPKRATNLSLDPDAIDRGEQFGKRHDTSLSQLVSRFLRALPAEDASITAGLTPAVQRLYAVVKAPATTGKPYHEHLRAKYGARS
ncbi:MAG: DUF6364 family protein [Gemmatimonadaceae bacterium]